MKVQIWYQEFTFNVFRQFNHSVAFDLSKAMRVREMDLQFTDRNEVLDRVFRMMNQLNVPPGHHDRRTFERIGHTSMSVGDFIVFDDEPTVLYLCAGCGWQREDVGKDVSKMKGTPGLTFAESWWNSLGNPIPDVSMPEYGQMWSMWAECFRQQNQTGV